MTRLSEATRSPPCQPCPPCPCCCCPRDCRHAQPTAVDATADLLAARLAPGASPALRLHTGCHSTLQALVGSNVARLVVFNLGYLPGGDKAIVTRPDTTTAALEAALEVRRTTHWRRHSDQAWRHTRGSPPGALATALLCAAHTTGRLPGRTHQRHVLHWTSRGLGRVRAGAGALATP